MFLNSLEIHAREATGAYDRLYASRDFLWPARPGRMVRRAASLRETGRALDAGCGDGKNALFLSNLGWIVDGFDISRLAISACERRFASIGLRADRIWQDDSRSVAIEPESYDIVLAYGLYHCLDEAGLEATHRVLTNALKKGGLFVFATLNDMLPLPADHATGDLFLRPHDHVEALFEGWTPIELENGLIEENHLPLVSWHQHSLTWAIYEKGK
jgi:SAM-dependent methyltransferase